MYKHSCIHVCQLSRIPQNLGKISRAYLDLGDALQIRDICLEFEPLSKVYNLPAFQQTTAPNMVKLFILRELSCNGANLPITVDKIFN